jgi:hypothetical protein
MGWNRLAVLGLGFAACHPEDDFRFSATLDAAPRAGDVPAVRELHASAATPVWLSVVLDDGEVRSEIHFDALAEERSVPILGFRPGTRTEVTLTATDAVGGRAVRRWEVETDPIPLDFPTVEPLLVRTDAMEPGWLLLDVKVPDQAIQYLLVLDGSGAPIWWDTLEQEIGDVRLRNTGTLLALSAGDAVERDWLGRTLRRWSSDPRGEGEGIVIGPDQLNHEIFPLADGFLAVDDGRFDADAFPTSYEAPEVTSPTQVADDAVVHVAWDGTLRSRTPMSALLDLQRIGFDSLDNTGNGRDWVHVNGVVADPADGGWVVSVRHQDALVKLTSDGELDWILGAPSGWRAPWSDHLLSPDPELVWPYHAHAPEVTPDGTLVVFDNQMHGYNPYEEPVPRRPSRAVGFAVDSVSRTVREVFSFDQTATGPLYSDALGDADVLAVTGNVLADYGFLDAQGDDLHADLGWGRKAIRLVEWTPSGEVVRDIRLRSDAAEVADGWKAYRVEHLPDPWPGSGPTGGHWVSDP